MASYNSDNKRIARNTIVIYANMLFGMMISLYTSRLVLEALGVSDYGLFNVVGGIISLFTFIFSSLSATTTRFINVEMGKRDGDLNKVFNVCNVLHIGMALLVFTIAEFGGIYYIKNILNIETGKETDAMFIFQVSIIVSCIGITNVPFKSLFNATEKFTFNLVVNILLKTLQLILVIFVAHYNGNRLRLYAMIMTVSTAVTYIIYHYYCFRYWPQIIKWRIVRNKRLYKDALVFNNYNLLSTVALMLRSQGSALLINFFFGTTVNGALAIAKSVESHVMAFTSKFDGAAAPQITQNYSAGNMERVVYLVCKVGKYCLLMMMLAFFPLWAEIDFVLHIWLVHVPDGALQFCYMTLLITFVSATGGGIVIAINASGKVAKFKTCFSILMCSCIPLGYYLLKSGMPAYTLLALFVGVDAVWRIIQLCLMHTIIRFPVKTYIYSVYLPAFKIAVLMFIFIYLSLFINIGDATLLLHGVRFAFIGVMTTILVYSIGLEKNERVKLVNFISRKI